MKTILASIAILAAAFAVDAQAQAEAQAQAQAQPTAEEAQAAEDARALPVTTLTCRSLLQASGDERDLLLAIFHGYVAGKRGDATMDTVKMAFATDDVVAHCIDKPDATVLDAFNAVQPQ